MLLPQGPLNTDFSHHDGNNDPKSKHSIQERLLKKFHPPSICNYATEAKQTRQHIITQQLWKDNKLLEDLDTCLILMKSGIFMIANCLINCHLQEHGEFQSRPQTTQEFYKEFQKLIQTKKNYSVKF